MKYSGKKAGLMPKGDNEDTESKTTKKTGGFKGKSNKLGGGGRFAQMEAKGKSPALAAFIGAKLYGKAKMHKMAAKGKKSAQQAA